MGGPIFQPVLQICPSNFLHHQTVKNLCGVSWRKYKITVAIDFWNTWMSEPDQYVGFLLKKFYSFGMFFEQDFERTLRAPLSSTSNVLPKPPPPRGATSRYRPCNKSSDPQWIHADLPELA